MTRPASGDLSREDLAVAALRQAGRLRLKVRGESMLPSLWPEDIVDIEAAALPDVRCGDIVLAYRDGRFFLHRLQAASSSNFLSRGDSMPGPDPIYSAEHLQGKMAGAVRAGKNVKMVPLSWWARRLGLLFCHSSWARRLALRLHQRRVATSQKTQVVRAAMPAGDEARFGLCNRETI